jgi:hypothetical protein
MKEEILDIAKKLYHNHLTPETATNLLLDLFAVSNSALIEGCKIVVDGYEGDGMENMQNRDEVFYEWCKRALEHCC